MVLTPPYDPILDGFRAMLNTHYGDGKRVNLAKKNLFTVDDRQPRDFDARKKLFLWFCAIDITVDSPNEVCLHLRGGVPWSPAISDWCDAQGAIVRGDPVAFVSLKVNAAEVGRLEELATLIEEVVAPERKYDTPSWKYVAPRAAGSLRRLRFVLSKWWGRRG